MVTVFASPRHGIVVTREIDGLYSWSGRYNGMSILKAIPCTKRGECILLLHPDASFRQVFENLLCISQEGGLVWSAKLPGIPDKFVGVELTADGLEAYAYSGFLVLVDPCTGIETRRIFTK